MKKLFFKFKNQNFGFTMVEVLVSTAIFLTVISITTATFLVSLKTQSYLLGAVNASENVSYALEVMSREIRMGNNFTLLGDTLSFSNVNHQTVIYQLDNNQIKRSVNGGEFQALTSSDAIVENLKFIIQGAEPDDNQQVKVTILIKIISEAGHRQFETYLQTTVSSRQPEI